MGDEDDLSSEDDMDKELKEWEKRQKLRKERALLVNEIADSEQSYLESLRLDSLLTSIRQCDGVCCELANSIPPTLILLLLPGNWQNSSKI